MGCYSYWKWHRRYFKFIVLLRSLCHFFHLLGLSSAALLSKAGLKVLVLEKHGKCGGACHIFKAEGYEFDVGIHYVGNLTRQTLTRTLLDQISDGQIQWAQLGKVIFSNSLPLKIYVILIPHFMS